MDTAQSITGSTAPCLPSSSHHTITITHVTAASCWALLGTVLVSHRQTSVTQTLHFLSRLIIQRWRQQHRATPSSCAPVLAARTRLYSISASSSLSVSCCPGSWCQHLSIYSPSLHQSAEYVIIITNKNSCSRA